jgi:hypothetical protein
VSFPDWLRRCLTAWVGGPIVALALVSPPQPALAQPAKPPASKDGPSPEARAANKHALDLFKDGKYQEALDQFQKAYDLSPSWIILCNIGKMSRFTQDFARSLVAYQTCLKDGGADVEPSQRTEVEQEIAQLVSLVGYAKIDGEAGAEVRVDGTALGTLPLDPKLPINPGPRTFASKKDAHNREQTVTVKAGETVDVDLSFDGSSGHPNTPDPARFRFPQAAITAAWIGTAVFAGTAIGTGTAALVMSSNLKGTVYVGPAQAPAAGSPLAVEAKRVGALSASTDAFIALAVITGAAGLSFTIVNVVTPAPKDQKASAGFVRVGGGPGSLSVTGAF